MILNLMVESNWTSSTRLQLYDRHNKVSVSNKFFFDRSQITKNVRIFLTRQNVNIVSRSKFWYLILNNHAITDIVKMRTIVSTFAIVKMIINYNSNFYSRYKLWMYFNQQSTSPKQNKKTAMGEDILCICNHVVNI